jgi:hypothetical protein
VLPSELLDPESYYPPRDRAGKVVPHKLEVPAFLRALGSGFLAFYDKTVPEDFWAEGVDGEIPTITISCPCGEQPVLRFLTRSFSLGECQCGRCFLHDGAQVRIGRIEPVVD